MQVGPSLTQVGHTSSDSGQILRMSVEIAIPTNIGVRGKESNFATHAPRRRLGQLGLLLQRYLTICNRRPHADPLEGSPLAHVERMPGVGRAGQGRGRGRERASARGGGAAAQLGAAPCPTPRDRRHVEWASAERRRPADHLLLPSVFRDARTRARPCARARAGAGRDRGRPPPQR